jgi:hypothetical protein
MNLDDLKATPSWQWPTDAGSRLLAALVDEKALKSTGAWRRSSLATWW